MLKKVLDAMKADLAPLFARESTMEDRLLSMLVAVSQIVIVVSFGAIVVLLLDRL